MPISNSLRRRLFALRLFCALVLTASIYLTIRTGNKDWSQRGGGIIVTTSLLVTFAQFRYESARAKLETTSEQAATAVLEGRLVEDDDRDRLVRKVGAEVRKQFDLDRRYLLLNALVTAAIGELLGAFGNLLPDLTK